MEKEFIEETKILSLLSDSIIITDKSGDICQWLAASTKIFGYAPEEILSENITTLLGKALQDLTVTDEFSEGVKCKHHCGDEVIVRIVQKVDFDNQLLWVCRDITTYKQIEHVLNKFYDDVHAELEKLVDEKTSDLKVLNEELEERVKQRTQELEIVQEKLLERAHRAGMAEVAIKNLHNIGNILNNITTSIYIIKKSLSECPVDGLIRASGLLQDNYRKIKPLLKEESNWETLISYFGKVSDTFREKSNSLAESVARLEDKTEEINLIITDQNEYAAYPVYFDKVDLKEMIDKTLVETWSILNPQKVGLVKKYEIVPDIKVQKYKLQYVLSTLIKYAIENMKKSLSENRTLTVIMKKAPPGICIQFIDTGCGIPQTDLKKIFNQEISNIQNGINLHTCANYMKEMKGKIEAYSDGPGKGAQITIHLNPA